MGGERGEIEEAVGAARLLASFRGRSGPARQGVSAFFQAMNKFGQMFNLIVIRKISRNIEDCFGKISPSFGRGLGDFYPVSEVLMRKHASGKAHDRKFAGQ